MANYRGPEMEPWGTPLLTDDHGENSPLYYSTTTPCFLCTRKDLIQFKRFPEIP